MGTCNSSVFGHHVNIVLSRTRSCCSHSNVSISSTSGYSLDSSVGASYRPVVNKSVGRVTLRNSYVEVSVVVIVVAAIVLPPLLESVVSMVPAHTG